MLVLTVSLNDIPASFKEPTTPVRAVSAILASALGSTFLPDMLVVSNPSEVKVPWAWPLGLELNRPPSKAPMIGPSTGIAKLRAPPIAWPNPAVRAPVIAVVTAGIAVAIPPTSPPIELPIPISPVNCPTIEPILNPLSAAPNICIPAISLGPNVRAMFVPAPAIAVLAVAVVCEATPAVWAALLNWATAPANWLIIGWKPIPTPPAVPAIALNAATACASCIMVWAICVNLPLIISAKNPKASWIFCSFSSASMRFAVTSCSFSSRATFCSSRVFTTPSWAILAIPVLLSSIIERFWSNNLVIYSLPDSFTFPFASPSAVTKFS